MPLAPPPALNVGIPHHTCLHYTKSTKHLIHCSLLLPSPRTNHTGGVRTSSRRYANFPFTVRNVFLHCGTVISNAWATYKHTQSISYPETHPPRHTEEKQLLFPNYLRKTVWLVFGIVVHLFRQSQASIRPLDGHNWKWRARPGCTHVVLQ